MSILNSSKNHLQQEHFNAFHDTSPPSLPSPMTTMTTTLISHNSTAVPLSTIRCDMCGRSVRDINELVAHMNETHNVKVYVVTKSNSISSNQFPLQTTKLQDESPSSSSFSLASPSSSSSSSSSSASFSSFSPPVSCPVGIIKSDENQMLDEQSLTRIKALNEHQRIRSFINSSSKTTRKYNHMANKNNGHYHQQQQQQQNHQQTTVRLNPMLFRKHTNTSI